MASEQPGLIVNGGTAAAASKSPAELLQEKHARDEAHQPTIEEVRDEEDMLHPPPSSATAEPAPARWKDTAAKDEAANSVPKSKVVPFDVKCEELFPALGSGSKSRVPAAMPMAWDGRKAAAPSAGLANGGSRSSVPSRTSTPTSGVAAPLGGPRLAMPGKHVEQIRFAPSQMLPRNKLSKPLADIVRDISRKSKARLDVREGPGGSYIFEGTGTVDAVRQALKEVAQQVGSKQSVRIPVPASARPHIIGRQGTVVQGIHDRTGARIQVPKPDDSTLQDEDDDSNTIDVLIEGDAVAAEMARREIEAIVKERTSSINLKLKNIPPELFPFIAGAHNSHLNDLEERTKTQVRVPRYDTWSKRPPPQEAPVGQIQFTADPDRHIHVFGDRMGAQEARAEIERRALELERQIGLRHLAINRGQHQFIIGDKGHSLHDFLAETGCSVILPPPSDATEFLTVIGPPDKIETGINRVMDLATSMQMASIDISRQHLNAPSGPHAYAQALTMYLQQRQIVRDLERMHNAHIVLPLLTSSGPVVWEVYSRDGRNTILARSDILNLVQAHPPSKLATLSVDPYYHDFLRSRSAPVLKEKYGVYLVVPNNSETSDILLVCEGPDQTEVPRQRPSTEEIAAFQRALNEAQTYLLSSLGDQSNIVSKSVPVPSKYHDKLRKFVAREESAKGEDHIPVRMLVADQQASLRGRSRDVQDLVPKIIAFVQEQEQDEKERDNKISFEFPQKFANVLIGRKGENINKLRDEFDVDIKVENGKVEVKGPPTKANAAKARIIALAKKMEDETTYVLKIAPQYHRDLIGQKGSQVNRLQERYNVRVQFPRAASLDESVNDAASEAGSVRNTRSNQAPDEVVIRGPRKGADGAREEILSLYQWVADHSYTSSVSVSQSQIPSLIGQRGREMDKLRTETGAQIDVPSVNDVADASGRVEIKLKGTKKQVEDARKLLLQRAKEFDETVTKAIDVDKKHHKSLIGGGGANIRKIVVECGGPDDGTAARIVRFPRPESDDSSIRLEGKEVIVDKIIAAIQEFVRQKEDEVVSSIDVPQSQHRHLIGRGGDTRRQLETQFNVVLDVPKQGSNRTDVKIRGPSSFVENAKTHILAMLKEQQGETVNVPRSLHHAISENGSFFRRLRNDHQVTVDHAGEQIPPRPSPTKSRDADDVGSLPLITDDPAAATDAFSWKVVDSSNDNVPAGTIPWVLSGKPENVAKARALLEKAILTASQPSATGYLILPDPRTYRFVIGPNGSQINAIRKRTNCKINVPKDQARDEAIEIKGSKESLELAKDMILDAVKVGTSGNGRA
ncbi:RNA binding effector protein [Coccidioides immitis RS]|uniref:RNA binding effector protein n=1 Tax=Coccidioides immitis (strain RS) TaxID=246410 RepID=J3KIR4_COCIM|nr:RNA binding effector protein [Coccidioides immitis RS]EAS35883.3 RNA binding effector protein [Coccidioides immitis RS]